ncbi:MAG: MmgE/PrpD family protein [Synergistota bacterium]|nr:MmgE/PrpD family protein [Synergistota bacterium]
MQTVKGSPEKRNRLVRYYESLTYETLPREVVALAKKCLVDVIACAVGGAAMENSRTIQGFCRENFQGTDAQLWWNGDVLSGMGAAFGNAYAASVLDIDDGSRTALGHPGGVVIPSVMAVAQSAGSSLGEVLASVVLGYDIGVRFGEVLLQNTVGRFHGTGTWAVVGAAAGVAHLFGRSSDVFLDTLGVAEAHASLSPVMKSIENGSAAKETMGWGAFTAIIAAGLAAKGFSGVESMLYHEEESRDYQGLDDLGGDFRITRTYFKRYSACRWTHAPAEAVATLMQLQGVSAGDIRCVTVWTHEKALSCRTVYPLNAIQAEYSIPLAVANMIIWGRIGPQQLELSNLQSESVSQMARKVVLRHSDECERMFPQKNTAVVEIELADGSVVKSGLVSPRGDYDDPLAMEEIVDKYHWLSAAAWNEKKRFRVLERIAGGAFDPDFPVRDLFV